MDADQDKRNRWREHWREFARLLEYYEANDIDYRLREYPAFPDDLRGMTCGAKSRRTGQPCKRLDIFSNGRCKFHGGASTGPTTEAGKKRSARNGKQGGRPRKSEAHEMQKEGKVSAR
jgi:hypothetical protein